MPVVLITLARDPRVDVYSSKGAVPPRNLVAACVENPPSQRPLSRSRSTGPSDRESPGRPRPLAVEVVDTPGLGPDTGYRDIGLIRPKRPLAGKRFAFRIVAWYPRVDVFSSKDAVAPRNLVAACVENPRYQPPPTPRSRSTGPSDRESPGRPLAVEVVDTPGLGPNNPH